jgi:hypothetical protein
MKKKERKRVAITRDFAGTNPFISKIFWVLNFEVKSCAIA